MFLFRQPKASFIREFLLEQARLSFTYPDVGSTATAPPANYVVDHTRVLLGTAEQAFQVAKTSLEGWRQFDLGWLKAFPTDTPIRSGEVVAVVAHTFGIWSLNSAQIVYVIDEPRKFGFAYGTLPGHIEMGEERFMVEIADDGSVWYDILAFSQPRHLLTKLGYPFVRRLQKRFGRESAAAMVRAVQGS